MAKLISKTYGDALYELAVEKEIASELMEEIRAVKQILVDNDEFVKLMLHPGVPKQEKLQMVEKIFAGRVSDDLTGFLLIITENERFKDIDGIFAYFIDTVKASMGIGVAYVTTPSELSEANKKAVEARLLETTDFASMEMNFAIDEELIGGMTIRIGDRVVDTSVRSKLNDLTKQLLQIQLQV